MFVRIPFWIYRSLILFNNVWSAFAIRFLCWFAPWCKGPSPRTKRLCKSRWLNWEWRNTRIRRPPRRLNDAEAGAYRGSVRCHCEQHPLILKKSICWKPLRDKAMAYKEHCYQRLGDFIRHHLGPDVILPAANEETALGSKKHKHKWTVMSPCLDQNPRLVSRPLTTFSHPPLPPHGITIAAIAAITIPLTATPSSLHEHWAAIYSPAVPAWRGAEWDGGWILRHRKLQPSIQIDEYGPRFCAAEYDEGKRCHFI